jgi:hypothetical protein
MRLDHCSIISKSFTAGSKTQRSLLKFHGIGDLERRPATAASHESGALLRVRRETVKPAVDLRLSHVLELGCVAVSVARNQYTKPSIKTP